MIGQTTRNPAENQLESLSDRFDIEFSHRQNHCFAIGEFVQRVLKGELPKTPDDLIDVQISTYPGWVLFSPHAHDHGLVLAYAPSKTPDPLVMEGVARQWRQLNAHWYELVEK